MDALVSTQWLAAHLDDPSVRILDGSFHVPGSGRDAGAEYRRGHIPGAQFFDIDGIRDESADLPHMLPSADVFAAHVGALGIGNDDHVVIYDAPGSAGSSRVWWTFRVFGHRRVSVLDGGLGKWTAEGRPVTDTPSQPRPASHRAGAANRALVRTRADLLVNLTTGREQVVDNRPPGRFNGIEPEPRPALKAGHVPGSVNMPFADFFAPERGGVWRSRGEIADLFARAGVDLDKPVVSTCGSGVTACTTALAAFLVGHDDVAVYDGSWVEWGNRDDTPVDR
jgi:thiosulfate/3-mercaptopyruvate sulfurtransferase